MDKIMIRYVLFVDVACLIPTRHYLPEVQRYYLWHRVVLKKDKRQKKVAALKHNKEPRTVVYEYDLQEQYTPSHSCLLLLLLQPAVLCFCVCATHRKNKRIENRRPEERVALPTPYRTLINTIPVYTYYTRV